MQPSKGMERLRKMQAIPTPSENTMQYPLRILLDQIEAAKKQNFEKRCPKLTRDISKRRYEYNCFRESI
jgi:hypothetical protein